MNNPATDLPQVFIDALTIHPGKHPAIGENAIRKNTALNVEFRHPFFFLPSRRNSVEDLIKMFRFAAGIATQIYSFRQAQDGKYYISRLEEFVHPEELIILIFGYVPFIRTIVVVFQILLGMFIAFIGQVFYEFGWV
ncbi:49_t:CDS:2 [Ambispora gerdemannii]|uniref:49_t:CDS:1 n=1 Tax=Ambispora gerdemannii TaxID=144530 RepID=A0A9N9DHW7_9GLOM|nr:49_t:CDS:2 [Ambispora gerdemannii]